MSWSPQHKTPDGIHGDRRYDRRYDITLDLRWRLVRRRKVLDSGTGSTVDLSSGGILFDAGRQLPVGLNVELSISWPALLHNVAAMQLVVAGRIVRAEQGRIAIHMVQHEFRTCGGSAAPRPLLASAARTPSALLHPVDAAKFETVQ